MKKWLLVFCVCFDALISQNLCADQSDCLTNETDDLSAERCVESESIKERHNKKGGTYLALMGGNGRADVEGNNDMGWVSFEFRFGRWVKDRQRVDFIHTNEGHPENNHRDGFAVQYLYRHPVAKYIEIEAGVGPYFSMNTTTQSNGVELDDKHWGVLASLAAIIRVPGIGGENTHLRIQYNHVNMIRAFNSNEVLFGLGFEIGAQAQRSKDNIGVQIGIMGSHFKTNHGGTEHQNGSEYEIKLLQENMGFSISAIIEGDDIRVDRKGIAARIWYEIPFGKKWSVGAGAGPYFSKNKLDQSGNIQVNAIVGIEFKREIGHSGLSAFFRFNRIVDFNNNDRDKADLGIAYTFGKKKGRKKMSESSQIHHLMQRE